MNVSLSPGLLLALLACLALQPAPADEAPSRDESKQEHSFLKQLPSTMLRPKFEGESVLVWRSGESLPGSFAGVRGDRVLWKTNFSDAPLEIRHPVLERLEFQTKDYLPPEGHFRIVLTDGSHLSGDPVKTVDGNLIFASSQTGRMAIKLDHIARIERLAGAGILLPHAQRLLDNEFENPRGNVPPPWMMTAAGAVASPAFHQQIVHSAQMPERGVLAWSFRTEREIAFALRLSVADRSFAVETWEDELVLKSGSNFVSAGSAFDPQDRQARLWLCWDLAEDRLALHLPQGEVAEMQGLTRTRAPERKAERRRGFFGGVRELFFGGKRQVQPQDASHRIQIYNKGAGMFIERFQIAEWSTAAPLRPPAEGPYVETISEFIQGTLTELGEHGQAVITSSDGTSSTIPLDSIRRCYWPRTPSLRRPPNQMEIWLADGQLLRGTLLPSTPALKLSAVFTDDPITVERSRLRAVLLPASHASNAEDPTLDELDVLHVKGHALHGEVAFDGSATPKFYLHGSSVPMSLHGAEAWSLSHQVEGEETLLAETLVHLAHGETIPMELTGIEPGRITFTSALLEETELDVSQVHAIHFAGPGIRNVGFGSGGWRALGSGSNLPHRQGNQIELAPYAAIGNPYALQGDEVSFRLKEEKGNASIRVRLFTQRTDGETAPVSFLIADYGSLYCGIEGVPGQMRSNTEFAKGSDPPLIQLRFSEDTVQLFVDDTAGPRFELDDDHAKAGTGIVIESTSIWGNSVGTVTLAGFSSGASPFMAGIPPYSADARRLALLLPRVRRNPPPRHLLIGRNGDLLRGEIQALTGKRLAFRTGWESFQIPRDRLAAIVWLGEPGRDDDEPEQAQVEDEDSRQWLDLIDGGRIALSVERWDAETVTGSHPLFGRCQIPTDRILRISPGEPSPMAAHRALAHWQLTPTRDPIPPEDEGTSSPLIGKKAKAFTLPTLEAESFALSKTRGRVVVLDFWATWCGPCVRSLPGLIEAMAQFPQEDVLFLAINQGEGEAQVRQFLAARNLQMPVALDLRQKVGRDYRIESIPSTVVIGRDGKVAFVKEGFTPNGNEQIAQAVRKALTMAADTGGKEPD